MYIFMQCERRVGKGSEKVRKVYVKWDRKNCK